MGVYATILLLQHPDELGEAMRAAGIRVVMGEGYDEERALGSPQVYRGSHVIPAPGDEQRGSVELAAISAFVEDHRRGVWEDEREGDLPWLRLSVQTGALRGEGDEATVVLDKAQAAELRDALDGWLSSVEGEERSRASSGPASAFPGEPEEDVRGPEDGEPSGGRRGDGDRRA